MCIRDSIFPTSTVQEKTAIRVRIWMRQNIPELLTVRMSTAVSYTHLQAHETVLDLVCRLLLEKKNNQITKPTSQQYRTEKEHDIITYL